MKQTFPRFSKRNRGSTLVMAVLGMIVLLAAGALAVDVAMVMLESNTTQGACDASALAACSLLKVEKAGSAYINTADSRAKAVAEAIFIGAQNGVTISPANVVFPQPGRVTVTATVHANYYLASLWGPTSASLSRSANAEKSTIRGISRAVPLGLSTTDYQSYAFTGANFQVLLARNTEEAFGPGLALALNLDAIPNKPVAEFEKQMSEGCPELVTIGQVVDSLNAATAQQNALLQAMTDRLDRSESIFPVVIIPNKAATVGTSTHPIQTLAMVRVFTVDSIDVPSSNPGPGKSKGGGGTTTYTRLTLRFLPDYVVNTDVHEVRIGTPGDSRIQILRLVDAP